MNLLHLKCRNESIYIPNNEIQYLSDSDWFLSLLLKYKNDTNIYEIGEHKSVVLSIIESLRHHEVILFDNIPLDYMASVAEKWCCPEWLKKKIKDKQKCLTYKNKNTMIETLLENHVYKCMNCKVGFKLEDNTHTSCKIHPEPFNHATNTFNCCGKGADTPYCQEGYHIIHPSSFHVLKLKKNMYRS